MAEVNNIKRKIPKANIKNKKAVKQTLAKASIKGKSTTKKVTKKPSTVKTTVKKPIIEEASLKELEVTPLNEIKEESKKKETKTTAKKTTKKTSLKAVYKEKTAEKKKKASIKEPNNIIRKIPKEEKEEQKEESAVVDVVETKDVLVEEQPKVKEKTEKQLKKEEKKKQRLEKRRLKREKKAKVKAEKKKLKEKELAEKKKQKAKDLKEKKNKKQQIGKTKIEYPKEWKTINAKNDKKVQEQPKTFKGKIKSSIFESIDEKELQERKIKSKESFKKTVIVILIISVLVAVIIYSLLKYNDFVKKQLAVYEQFRIGDVVYLEDESVWFVIEDSDSKNENVKLLANSFADVNLNGTVEITDVIEYNKDNTTEYSADNENSVAYLLKKKLKGTYEEKIGKIVDIDILTAKEYVKIRERLNFGDEWTTQNWLAGKNIQNYWIQSDKNNKVYVVTEKGTFNLSEPKKQKFVRPTIVIKKENVTKIKEKSNITVDLINGLKRK